MNAEATARLDRDAMLRKVAEVAKTIREEMPGDVERRDGLPFDGRTVAGALGEICAQVMALAQCVEMLAADLLEAERTS